MMSVRRDTKQTSLLDLISTRQPRRQARESSDIYDVIRALRRAGISVYAEGKGHRVRGSLMDTREMMLFARQIVGGQL